MPIIEQVPVATLRPYQRQLKKHSPQQIELLANSVRTFGLVQPLVADENNIVIAGAGLLQAAIKVGCEHVPVVRVKHLDEASKKALRIALNKLAELSQWDDSLLAIEFNDMLELELSVEVNFDFSITGFTSPEVDQLISNADNSQADDPDVTLSTGERVISELGDLWLLGDHRLICGNSLEEETYKSLLGSERAHMGIHDAPYDVKIEGHVSSSGRHTEFVMGSGELGDEFVPFLSRFLKASKDFSLPGAYQYCFMDWRHMMEMSTAGQNAGLVLKNLCVWDKGVGGMGSLYRSQHELVFVFADPKASGTNNVQLGKFGRNRTNVWSYPGSFAMRDELALHPTPKNVAMIADAIRDVSPRNGIVLDAFSGSGTTIIAAAKTGRRAYAIELDPKFVDVGVKRWQEWSGKTAHHAQTGLSFAKLSELRQESREQTVSSASAPSRVRRRVRIG
ncbi:hypothetical protein GGR20_003260 [Devosia subaequoris]|uniref:Methyltransferase n=2 Tax=Devosia subaequoris TaxID=395930 RepID=A0A7W6IPW1_9HYPH|nr:DNA methyltransferase [Devosia subaequoris]MBB4053598.1 hypothetical protein [Devosia subaequoris]